MFLGEDFVRSHLEGGGRILQVNLWRPVRGPVERSPLAVADAASVNQEDLIPTRQVFPTGSERYHLRHAPQQRWFYASKMTSDEALLLKSWDSATGEQRVTPHAAFQLPDEKGKAPRETSK